MKHLLVLTALLTLLVPCYAQKKKKQPKPPPPPTQGDITEGCVVVRNITYQHARGFTNTSTGVEGTISNGCARETEVWITITFYNSYNNLIDVEFVTKLVKPAATINFWGGPDWQSNAATYAATGRVTSVSVRMIP